MVPSALWSYVWLFEYFKMKLLHGELVVVFFVISKIGRVDVGFGKMTSLSTVTSQMGTNNEK